LTSLTWGNPAHIASSPTKPEHAESAAFQLTTRKSGKLQYMYRRREKGFGEGVIRRLGSGKGAIYLEGRYKWIILCFNLI